MQSQSRFWLRSNELFCRLATLARVVRFVSCNVRRIGESHEVLSWGLSAARSISQSSNRSR